MIAFEMKKKNTQGNMKMLGWCQRHPAADFRTRREKSQIPTQNLIK